MWYVCYESPSPRKTTQERSSKRCSFSLTQEPSGANLFTPYEVDHWPLAAPYKAKDIFLQRIWIKTKRVYPWIMWSTESKQTLCFLTMDQEARERGTWCGMEVSPSAGKSRSQNQGTPSCSLKLWLVSKTWLTPAFALHSTFLVLVN